MIEHPVEFSFPFEANFIPRGGQKTRPGQFMGKDFVEIREAAPDEAVVAFRVHYLSQRESFDILAFEGKSWWPLLEIPARGRPGECDRSKEALLSELATCELDILGMLRDQAERPVRVEEMDLREFDPSQREAALAYFRHKIGQNFLIYRDQTYVLGGEPVFIAGGDSGWVVSSGADRSIYPQRSGLDWPPGGFAREDVQVLLSTGAFFAVNDHQRFAKDVEEHGPRGDFVEVLVPEMITLSRPQLQLDALFRLIVRLRDFCTPYRAYGRRDIRRRRELRALTLVDGRSDTADSETNRVRLKALDLVQPILKGWDLHYGALFNTLQSDILRFKETERAFIASHPLGELTAEEADALRSLDI